MSEHTNPLSTTHTEILPLSLDGGGIGVRLECNAITPTVAREIPIKPGMTITVFNDGDQTGYFVIGDRFAAATNYCTPVAPRGQRTFKVSRDGGTYTHVSGLAKVGSTALIVNWGASGV
jgi:hypothetical protein